MPTLTVGSYYRLRVRPWSVPFVAVRPPQRRFPAPSSFAGAPDERDALRPRSVRRANTRALHTRTSRRDRQTRERPKTRRNGGTCTGAVRLSRDRVRTRDVAVVDFLIPRRLETVEK